MTVQRKGERKKGKAFLRYGCEGLGNRCFEWHKNNHTFFILPSLFFPSTCSHTAKNVCLRWEKRHRL